MMKITIDKVGQVLKSIHTLETNRVLVGIPQEKNARNDGQMTNASIGYIQENGSSANNIPARPFLIPGVEKVNKEAAQPHVNICINRISEGSHPQFKG